MLSELELRRLGEYCRGVAQLLERVHEEVAAYGELDELGKRREVKQFGLLQGVLWVAAENLIEALFEEYERCIAAAKAREPWAWEQEPVCGGLPPRFAEHYRPRFVRQLIVAAGSVTARLAGEWVAPVSVIEEIAAWLLLEQAHVVVDENELSLDPGWHDELESLLLEDLDVQELWEAADDAELVQIAGPFYLPSMWGTTFAPDANQAPFVTVAEP